MLQALRTLQNPIASLPDLWILLHTASMVRLVSYYITPWTSTNGGWKGDMVTDPLNYTLSVSLATLVTLQFVYPPIINLLALICIAIAHNFMPSSVRSHFSPSSSDVDTDTDTDTVPNMEKAAAEYVQFIHERLVNNGNEQTISIYNQFLKLLKDYKSNAINTPLEYVIEQASILFADHPDLMKRFRRFLPKINVDVDVQEIKKKDVKAVENKTVKRASRGSSTRRKSKSNK
jgi:hypothetical protein